MGNALKKYSLAKAKWERIGGAITGDTLPIGSMIPFGGTEAPTGWLICDGSMLNREAYKELFEAIGTNFGTDGPGNFYIPDLRGKVVVGQDTTDSDFGMGATGGEKKHTLTVEEMPSHTHTTNTVFPFTAGGLTTCTPNSDSASYTGVATDVINATGGNQPHNNLQPYQVTNYIIKAFQSAGLVGNVVNEKTTSKKDTYSCDYVNEKFSYSTEEKVVGEWIDGKPIYRKVVPLETLPNQNTIQVSSGLDSSIVRIVNIYGIATDKTNYETFPIPFSWGSGTEIQNYCTLFFGGTQSSGNVWFRTNRNMSNYEGYAILEYTKTTDITTQKVSDEPVLEEPTI